MSEVKWIKIATDIFNDEKILLIEKIPGGDSILVIWLKLLTMAGKHNNSGVLMMNDCIAYTDEMLATIFRRDLNTVRMALSIFEQYGMVEIIEGVITIPNWSKHQTLDKIEKRNEYQKEYMKEYRAKQKQLACNTNVSKSVSPNSKPNVSNLEEELEGEEELDKKRYIVEIVAYLNHVAGTSYRDSSKTTIKHINARLKEGYTVDDFKQVIDKKCFEWLKDKEWAKYLRPETLFGTKFESYLNQQIKGYKPTTDNDVILPY